MVCERARRLEKKGGKKEKKYEEQEILGPQRKRVSKGRSTEFRKSRIYIANEGHVVYKKDAV